MTDPRSNLPVLKHSWTYYPLDQGSVGDCGLFNLRQFELSQSTLEYQLPAQFLHYFPTSYFPVVNWSQVHPSEEPGDNCLTSGQGSYRIDQGSVPIATGNT